MVGLSQAGCLKQVRLTCLFLFVFILYFSSTVAHAQAGRQSIIQPAELIAVIYPDIDEPFRTIFAQIVEGIEAQAKFPLRTIAIGPNTEAADINAALKRSGVKTVIALGRQGIKIAFGLDRDISVVIGGVLSIPDNANNNWSGITLTPDPALLFSRLRSMLPGIKKIYVAYNPQQNEWLLRLAREAAKAQGLELVAHEARDLAAAAHVYDVIFGSIDNKRDAIWLPQDTTTVDETTILPLVLKQSWNKVVPIFSSSFVHVKKGALFALYPSNVDLGRGLATLAISVTTGDTPKRILPLREVQTAVNLRTASHIGLNIGYQQQRSFNYIYPEP